MNQNWDILLQYQSVELVKRRFNERHGRSLQTSKAMAITAAIMQGRAYFTSVSDAAISVRPLLLYYGVLALTRALILFSSRSLSEAALRPAHGLAIIDWQRVLANGWVSVGDLRMKVQRGTFTELLEITNNKVYLRANSSGVNWQVTYDILPTGTEFSFGSLCQCVPDAQHEFEVWQGREFSFAQLESFKPNATAETFEAGLERSQRIDDVFPETLCDPRTITQNGNKITVIGSNRFTPFFVQYFGGKSWIGEFAGVGDVWIVPILPNQCYLNTLGVFFSISFTLGMLVRYYPSVWVSLGIGRGDAVSPLIHQMLALVESKYPQLVVDYLKAPYPFEGKTNAI